MAPTCEVDSTTEEPRLTLPVPVKNAVEVYKKSGIETNLVHTNVEYLKISNEKLHAIRNKILENVEKGISLKTKGRNIPMLPTFVNNIPDGTEKGIYLALDLGGSVFRIVKVALPGVKGRHVEVHSQVYHMPKNILNSTAEEFFDNIAVCLADFLEHHGLEDCKLPLGFTFSFPCEQKGLDESILLRWTKGYNVSGVVGEDIVKLLRDSINRQCEKGIKCMVEIVAVINDTVGTLMSCAYEDQNCSIGMIVGTGTNACYMESVHDIKFLEGSQINSSRRMCINTEWGEFGEDGSLDEVRTTFDKLVDASSINPGFMIYEKMIGSLYLGDIVREILLHLIRTGTLLEGILTYEMEQAHSFQTSFITQIELDRTPDLYVCKQILINLGYLESTISDRKRVREICRMVSTRSAHLCAAGVSALVERLKSNHNLSPGESFKVTVAVDGTLYKKHPTFKHILQTTVHELSPESDVTFRISYDGGGKGAALVSAVACKNLNA
ncbi:hexokinase-2-like [Styela clava]